MYACHRAAVLPPSFRTTWSYPTLTSNGTNIEVEWLSPFNSSVQITAATTSDATITSVLDLAPDAPSRRVNATPLQFHFHATSEHTVDGKYFPLEMHIVHMVTDLPGCAGGCFTVTGVVFELVEGPDNPLLAPILDNAPLREGTINKLPAGLQIPVNAFLPAISNRTYVTEGLLWHVFTEPQTISRGQWARYRNITSLKECVNATTTATGHRHAASRRLHEHAPEELSAEDLITAPEAHATAPHARQRSMLLCLADSLLGGLLLGSSCTYAPPPPSPPVAGPRPPPPPNPNNFRCTPKAYGYNYRNIQPVNGRTVKLATA
ncbi:hypothetical protein HYH03_014755 [Edaphochlamys debaryana]|uniref:Carbonic anhydrase n=1 Tax=Edaphochlamys debaryana TaxID=47281 RepID=A0A835XN96_9CHLO|nr:hypothetical protein HYH03_014755 [Edaphochlamys debaryana]|eukprot:KAG2486585.1 hypothetical protein HYH03_014755 [Edaphochlamys debaryana]